MTDLLTKLQAIVQDRLENPREGSYTNQLLDEGLPRIAQKVGEEGVEVVIAALVNDDDALAGEIADWIYHTTVLLAARGLKWDSVAQVLEARHRVK